MKTINVVLHWNYSVEVDDEYNLEEDKGHGFEILYGKLENQITSNNQTINNEFWEHVSVKG